MRPLLRFIVLGGVVGDFVDNFVDVFVDDLVGFGTLPVGILLPGCSCKSVFLKTKGR